MTTTAPGIAEALADVVGAEHVVTDHAEREHLSRDLSFEAYEVAEVVVAPASTEELAAVVARAREAGMPVVPRGGGMSYTRGYTPERPGSLLVDLRRMDAVVEVNGDDLYAVLEAGCSPRPGSTTSSTSARAATTRCTSRSRRWTRCPRASWRRSPRGPSA